MWNTPSETRLTRIPTDTREVKALDHIVHLHFFLGGSDWYVVEYNEERREFFGFVILNEDIQFSEFGYFSFDELIELKKDGMEVDCECAKYFKPTPIIEIKKLKHLIAMYRN